jgi:NADH-quinone oxidoreductase subunit D
MQAYKMIRQIVKNIPDGPLPVKAPTKVPAGEALSRYEAPRGEDVHYVRANGTDKPDRVKIRPPTLANLQAVAHMLEDRYLADLPIVIAAIDPCFSCTDRAITLIDSTRDRRDTMTWDAVRRIGVKWYKNAGVDFNKLNKKLAKGL